MKQLKKEKLNLIIRESHNIKSRQWWQKRFKELISYLRRNKIKNKYLNLEICLLITGNSEIKSLNKKFRKKNKATDVLSFESNNLTPKSPHLGDIVISMEKAKTQAKKRRVKIEDELFLLLIHGYLHLLGYDHEKKKDEEKMFNLQNMILVKHNHSPFYL